MNDDNKRQRPTGFDCPVCKGYIPVAMSEILGAGRITCPHCGLELQINKKESRKAIDALQRVNQAEDRVKKTSVFNG